MDAVEAFPAVGLVEVERAGGGPLDDEVPGRDQRAAVPHASPRNPPQLATRDGIPREEELVGSDVGEALGEVRVLPRERGPARLEPLVRHLGTVVELVQRTPQHGLFTGRNVGDAGLRVERHRLPVVPTGRGRKDDPGLVPVVRGGVRDGPARLHVDPERPVHRDEVLRPQQLSRGAVQHVEEAVLRRLEENLSRLAIDHDGAQDDVLGRRVVPDLGGHRLVVPHEPPALRVDREDRDEVQVVAAGRAPVPDRIGIGVPRPHVEEVEDRVVGHLPPYRAPETALPGGVRVPRLSGDLQFGMLGTVRRVPGHGEEAPPLFTRLEVVGGNVPLTPKSPPALPRTTTSPAICGEPVLV